MHFAQSRFALFFAAASMPLLFGACHRAPPTGPPPDPVAAFALHIVQTARSANGLGPDVVDADVVELLRRIQLVLRTTMDTWEPAKLLDVFSGNAGPDRKYPPSDRPKMQRDRATRGLRAALVGHCTTSRWDEGRDGRVKYLVTAPGAHLPDEILQGQAQAAAALATAEAARVHCDQGDVGLLFIKGSDDHYRLVDVFPTERQMVQIHPDDPNMK